MREFFEEEDHDFEEEIEDEMENLFEQMGGFPAEAVIEITNLSLVKSELKFRLLKSVTKMLEKSFFWKFRSPEWKRNAIRRAYLDFESLLGVEE